jgi:ketosteroid isomerase-like protein
MGRHLRVQRPPVCCFATINGSKSRQQSGVNGMSTFFIRTNRFRSLMLVLSGFGMFAVLFSVLPALAADDMDAAAKVLAKLDDDWSAAAATKDAEKVASFYAENAIAYPPNEPVCTGRAAAKKVWAAYFADPSFTISWKTTHAEVAKSGELGFTAGPYEASFNGPDGKVIHEKGKYLCNWKKQADGTWKAIHDMWNADSK